MKVALVHDWLITYRGGEKVLEALCELFPDADLFTLIHCPGQLPKTLEQRRITTSFLQHVPDIQRRYRHLLPLFPRAIASFDLSGYDLIISSSHCVAKGIRKPLGVQHLSYVHTPMRYMWDRFDDYFGPGRSSLPVRLAASAVRPAMQRWDRRSSQNVDALVANSRYIADKIERFYGRNARVVHPFVDLERFARHPVQGSGRGGYFLWMGALAPYKRVDLAVEAFRAMKTPLWIAGAGQEGKRLSRHVPSNVRVLGHVSDEELTELYRNARALIFTADEDFGITPLEAQATGRPVIAFGRGGVLETVTSKTGIFFAQQSAASLAAAIRTFDEWEEQFEPANARAQAERFSRQRFLNEMRQQVDALLGSAPLASPRRERAVGG
jgi:glycosyltransferase involved in cell wall biosynthesis